jgi:two-component system cell cycle response regulator DivK
MDGFEVAHRLKADARTAPIPVIALTAHAMKGDKERTLEAGCDGYIPKPVDVADFPDQISAFLKGREWE